MTLQEKLHHLFLLESQVRGLRRRLDGAMRRQTALQTKLDQLTRQHAELTDQIKHFQAKSSSLEHQAGDIDERVGVLRTRMTQVTSNKEYSALLVEVNTLKLNKDKLEEQALAEMGHVEELQEQAGQLDTTAREQERLLSVAKVDVSTRQSEVGQRLEEVTAERDEASANVPISTRQIFERLAQSYDGEAMASVTEVNRRAMEYNCDGCYMKIPVEVVNALYTKPDEPTVCPNCARLLFLDEEFKAAMGPKDRT